jgi:hypothetical protein
VIATPAPALPVHGPAGAGACALARALVSANANTRTTIDWITEERDMAAINPPRSFSPCSSSLQASKSGASKSLHMGPSVEAGCKPQADSGKKPKDKTEVGKAEDQRETRAEA